MAAKLGRPRKPKGQQKIPFPIRFTRDDVALFTRKARAANITLKEWVTLTLKQAAKQS